MSKQAKRLCVAVWMVFVCGFCFLLLRVLFARKPARTESNIKRIVGSEHYVSLYRITWPSTTIPKLDMRANSALIEGLPWKGGDKDSLNAALHDPSAKVEFLEKRKLQDGVELVGEERDNAQHELMFGNGWSDPNSRNKIAYQFKLSDGIARIGWTTDVWADGISVHGGYPAKKVVAPQQYACEHQDVAKLPSGTYERRIYVVAIS